MKLLYYRIYYTIYRVLIRIGQVNEDSPRYNVVLLMSLFQIMNVVTIMVFLSISIRKNLFVANKFQNILFIIVVICFNWYMVLYKKKYIKNEERLLNSWSEERNKNILITIGYIMITIFLVFFSFYCADQNPLKNK